LPGRAGQRHLSRSVNHQQCRAEPDAEQIAGYSDDDPGDEGAVGDQGSVASKAQDQQPHHRQAGEDERRMGDVAAAERTLGPIHPEHHAAQRHRAQPPGQRTRLHRGRDGLGGRSRRTRRRVGWICQLRTCPLRRREWRAFGRPPLDRCRSTAAWGQASTPCRALAPASPSPPQPAGRTARERHAGRESFRHRCMSSE